MSPSRILRVWLLLTGCGLAMPAPSAELYLKQSGWVETMLGARAALAASGLGAQDGEKAAVRIGLRVKEDFPVQWDWTLLDRGH